MSAPNDHSTRKFTKVRQTEDEPTYTTQSNEANAVNYEIIESTKSGEESQESTVQLPHTTDIIAYNVDKTMKTIDNIMLGGHHTPQLCPWHTQQVTQVNGHASVFNPMERYMAETEAEQSAVYHGCYEGTLSITKPCTCAEVLSVGMKSSSNMSSTDGHRM